jgi:hypothetical protein
LVCFHKTHPTKKKNQAESEQEEFLRNLIKWSPIAPLGNILNNTMINQSINIKKSNEQIKRQMNLKGMHQKY